MQKKMRADIEAFLPEIRELVKASVKLDVSEIVRIGGFVAEKVYALQRLTDSEKKAAVLELVAAALAAQQVSPEVSTAAAELLPAAIDLVANASHVRLHPAGVVACLGRFWNCFSRKNPGLVLAGAVKVSKKASAVPVVADAAVADAAVADAAVAHAAVADAPVAKASEKKVATAAVSLALRTEKSSPSSQQCSNCDCEPQNSLTKDTQPAIVCQKESSPVASLAVVLEDGEIPSDDSAKELPNMPSA
jgi:hypothetical protein